MARRHHLVPRMLLKRFANPQGRLVMVERQPPHKPIPTTVNTACAECGFYSVPTEEVDDKVHGGHDPESVENMLSRIESWTHPLIGALVSGVFPPSEEERYTLSMFTALQATRGWRFREDMDRLGTLLARQGSSTIPLTRIRDTLRTLGAPHNDETVRATRNLMLNDRTGPQLRMSRSFAVRESLVMALGAGDLLYNRPLRLLRFSDDVLLTSDHPVGMWAPAPGGDAPTVGIGTASMVILPLDRRTALAFAASGDDKVSYPGTTRARQINLSIIENARRWIFHHPDDAPLRDIDIPPREEIVSEIIKVRKNSDGTVEEIYRVSRGAARP